MTDFLGFRTGVPFLVLPEMGAASAFFGLPLFLTGDESRASLSGMLVVWLAAAASDFLGLPLFLVGDATPSSVAGSVSDFLGLPRLLTGDDPLASFNGMVVVIVVIRVERAPVGESRLFSSCEKPLSGSTVTLMRQGDEPAALGVVMVMDLEGEPFARSGISRKGSDRWTLGESCVKGWAAARLAERRVAALLAGELVTNVNGSGEEDILREICRV